MFAIEGPSNRGAVDFLSQAPISAKSEKAEKLVNKYLQGTYMKMEMEKIHRRVENEFAIPRMGDRLSATPEANTVKTQGVEMEPDRNADAVAKVIDHGQPQSGGPPDSPDSVIQGELYDRQKQEEYEKEYRVEYRRQFVENALRHGYIIDVDENMVVRSVRKVPRGPSEVFDPSASSQR